MWHFRRWLFLFFFFYCGYVIALLGRQEDAGEVFADIPRLTKAVTVPKKTLTYLASAPYDSLATQPIEDFYYHSLVPVKKEQEGEMVIYDVYLGENTGMKEALGWLKYAFPQKNFQHHFSYALYNQADLDEVSFDFRLKDPPPHFLLAYFEAGTREGQDETFSLATLKKQGHGASSLYYFWSQPKPYLPQTTPFRPENYQVDILYDQGTNFGGPSYFFLHKVILKDREKNQVVGVFPMNQKIEEPFFIFNYDFALKFPFYNYVTEGVLWNTNHIKSLKKIDLYEQKTKQKRTLYYDVE
ncbi:hypothetical protein [Candidatus Phytoplasma phoenicium]|nr:hypothetical protein [Candidatus Phytoplasma phoenicium]